MTTVLPGRARLSTSSRVPRYGRRRAAAGRGIAVIVAAVAGWGGGSATSRGQTSLTWDPQQTGVGSDGSGTWDSGNPANPVWSTGAGNTDWDNAVATAAQFGNVGTVAGAANVVTLGSDIAAAAVGVNAAGTGGSYTFNAAGHALTAAAGSLVVSGLPVTLTNGTYTFGNANPGTYRAYTRAGGTLTVGAGATLATDLILGDGTASASTVRFAGGTFRPLANANVDVNGAFYSLYGTTNAYVAAGGLTVDDSFLAAQPGRSYAILADPLQHDPATAGTDGGLTLTGGGILVLGNHNATPTAAAPSVDPVETYTGPTTVGGGVLALVTGGNAATTGPFPNTRFVVAATGVVEAYVNDGLAGATGTTPVTLNGGRLVTAPGVTCHLANVTAAGGNLSAASAANGSAGLFALRPGAELHAVPNPLAPGSAAQTLVDTVNLALASGSDLRADAAAYLLVLSPVVDESATTPSQLTVNGPAAATTGGYVQLAGAASYSGPTTVSSGALILAPFVGTLRGTAVTTAGTLSGTRAITVAAGASFADQGYLTSVPAVTVNGQFAYGRAVNAPAGPEVLTLASLTLGSTNGAGGTVTLGGLAPGASRKVLVTGGLTIAGSTNAWVGTVDLSSNDMVVQNGNLATVTNQVTAGYANGAWSGNGIASSAAAANATHLTALGVILNSDASAGAARLYGSGAPLGLFSTTNPGSADVLVRYTYYGDANLDGKVDGADYTRVDAGFASRTTSTPLTGWYNGDFNYDGKVDGSDYTLIDNAFDLQSTTTPLVPNASAGSAAAGAPASATNNVDLDPILNAAILPTTTYVVHPQPVGAVASATSETAVPEPAALTPAVLASAAVLRRRRRTA